MLLIRAFGIIRIELERDAAVVLEEVVVWLEEVIVERHVEAANIVSGHERIHLMLGYRSLAFT